LQIYLVNFRFLAGQTRRMRNICITSTKTRNETESDA